MTGLWRRFRRRPRQDHIEPATVYLSPAGTDSSSYATRWSDETTEPLSTVGCLTFGQARLYALDNEGR